MLWIPAVGTTEMITICAMGLRLHTPESGLQPGNLDLKEGINFGVSTYESDPDKWKAAGCPRYLADGMEDRNSAPGAGLIEGWLQERSQDVLMTRGLQRKRDFSAVFPPNCSLEGRLLITSETYLAYFRWFINAGIHRGQMKHGQ